MSIAQYEMNQEKRRTTMAHLHWCDVTGHEWECQGTALRLLRGDTEPTPCYCLHHQSPMEDGRDHSQCSIELLACPEHSEQQLLAMGYEHGQAPAQAPAADVEESSMFKDADGNHIVGFCLWCNRDFYSMEEVEAHNADDMPDCPAFQTLKDENCMPPVMQAMLEQAGLLDDDSADEEK
jgi:hypothetical protein